ncbi:MAG: glutamate---cysteine ligase / carboxylate-amine ligase [Actinomycetota bacterium]|nr:glutamate---cysteine ligase / carboxylate-amine ligase [Actinomycetota bacterium]
MQIPFVSSQVSSLGIEWELELVDLETRQLRAGATDILAEMSPGGVEHPKAKYELFESCIEVITGVCRTVEEALADLAATVEDVREQADKRGLGLMCSGSHPMTDPTTQTISPKVRYQELVDQMQWLARDLQIFGVHVHVGVRSPDKVIPIVNALTAYIPHFLSLSASSPYWVGHDTGLASSRSKVFERLPTAGLPFQLSGWPQFEDYMETLISTKTIGSIKEVWWDIRPHPTYGTVELRICDGLPTLGEIGMVAALSHCLVDTFDREIDKGYTLPMPKGWVVRENKWRAARYGLDAEVISGENDTTQPIREALADLVRELRPAAERLGCSEQLSIVNDVVEHGASYQRQRAVAAASGGDLTAVVDSLIEEFATGRRTDLPTLQPATAIGRPAAAGASS